MITAVVPDDGADLEILKALRAEKGIVQAYSFACLGSSATAEAKTKPGKLPEPTMVRMVEVLVPERDADDVFDFISQVARVIENGRGLVWQESAPFSTPYELPEGVPDERA
jgi:hypothetical protein